MGAVFYFLPFLLYGTDTLHLGDSFPQHLDIAQSSDMDTEYFTSEIVRLRSLTLP
jgi:hypothetical protein